MREGTDRGRRIVCPPFVRSFARSFVRTGSFFVHCDSALSSGVHMSAFECLLLAGTCERCAIFVHTYTCRRRRVTSVVRFLLRYALQYCYGNKEKCRVRAVPRCERRRTILDENMSRVRKYISCCNRYRRS